MRPSRLSTLCAFAMLLGLGACVEATPYQPSVASSAGGFTETKIEADRYRISFTGNSRTSRDTVETYLLHRAAEVTLDAGADWFRIVEDDTEANTRVLRTGPVYAPYYGPYFGPYYGPYYRPFYGPSLFRHRYHSRHKRRGFRGFAFLHLPIYPYGYGRATTREVTSYASFAEIKVYRGEKPADDPSAYDAREVIAAIGPTLRLPEPG